jgi:predicted outer membrane protein
MWVPLLVTGAALASPPVAALAGPQDSNQTETPETKAKLSQAFSVLHTVTEAATNYSKMAETRAKSSLVKDYASAMAAANAKANEKLMRVAKQEGIEIVPLDPKTEEGKSVLDRIKAETVLLGSLEGDAWDKEYMVLVTNHQQSLIRALGTQKALAKDKDVKQFLGELITTVQNRLKTSQDILEKIYRDKV